jgi:hypothetical protein
VRITLLLTAFLLAAPAAADPSSKAGELLARFDAEPDVRAVQQSAVKYARTHPDKVDRWRARARASNLLPELRLAFNRDQATDSSQTRTSGTGDPRATTGADDKFGLDVRVAWDLNKAIYDPAEVQIQRETIKASRQRDSLVAEVTKLYFERRRAQVKLLLDRDMDLRTQIKQELKIAELTAYLDGLTGGWFSSQLPRTR